MKKAKIVTTITFGGKKVVCKDEVEYDKEAEGLYQFCHNRGYGYEIQNEVARLMGLEIPDL